MLKASTYSYYPIKLWPLRPGTCARRDMSIHTSKIPNGPTGNRFVQCSIYSYETMWSKCVSTTFLPHLCHTGRPVLATNQQFAMLAFPLKMPTSGLVVQTYYQISSCIFAYSTFPDFQMQLMDFR